MKRHQQVRRYCTGTGTGTGTGTKRYNGPTTHTNTTNRTHSQTRKPSKTENHLSHTAQTCPRKKCHLRLTPPARSPHANSGRPRPVGAVAWRLERVEDLRGKPQVRRRASHLSNEDALAAAEAVTLRAHELVVEALAL